MALRIVCWSALGLLLLMGSFEAPVEAQTSSSVVQVYLTLASPSSSRSMRVHYQSDKSTTASHVYYDVQSRGGNPGDYQWSQVGVGESLSSFPNSIHSIELKGLVPGLTYYFVVGDPDFGFSQEMKFRTLPEDGSEIRVIQGGDMNISETYANIARPMLKKKPHLYFIGGDIAYGNGWTSNGWRWRKWFDQLKTIQTDPDGYLIPLVVAVGNHETNFGNGPPLDQAPFYFRFFPQNGRKAHFMRELGTHTAMFVLDSGHVEEHGGSQTQWLEGVLQKYSSWKNKIALYHVPLYPSHRSFNTHLAKEGRKFWLPLFDRFGLTLGMENHDHTLKRTYLLRGGKKVKADGTLFIGDGCWGQGVRRANSAWYLETSKSERHAWFLRLSDKGIQGEAYGEKGQRLDEFDI